MGNFQKIHAFVRKWEGGLSDDVDDAGGVTKYGVSLAFLSDLFKRKAQHLSLMGIRPLPPSRETIVRLTEEQAEGIFLNEFWYPMNLYYKPICAQWFLYDTAVNCGISRAVKIVQRAINQMPKNDQIYYQEKLQEDGSLGPLTSNAIDHWSCPDLWRLCIKLRKDFYQNLAESKPTQKKFLNGWMNRVNDLEREMLNSGCL